MRQNNRKPKKEESKKKLIKIALRDFEGILEAVTTEALSRFAGTYGYNLTLSVATSWYFGEIRRTEENESPEAKKEKKKAKEDKGIGALLKKAKLEKFNTKALKEKLKSHHPEYYN
jgi:hypothetical protein